MPDTEPVSHEPFPVTHWSLVIRAGGDEGAAKRQALSALLKQYLPALRSHLVLRKRVPRHDAEDLLQAFLADKVLDRDLIAQADRDRGKFRTFLLTALDNFVKNQWRARLAGKRGASNTVPLDDEHDRGEEPLDPGDAFDVEWARQVIRQAIDGMRRECEATGRNDIWGVFEARTLRPMLNSEEPVPYGRLVDQFGFSSPAQASNVLITANRMFARNLRAVVGTYELAGEDVEREIADLRKILSHVPTGD